MKPPIFDYAAPQTLPDALALLEEFGDDAKILAGGQTLGPMLNLRVLQPRVLVDINRVAQLGGHGIRDGAFRVGALTRQAVLEDDPDLCRYQPLVAQAIPFIAHRPIRNRATIGGSLAHADPAAEWAALALALDARFTLARASGERTVLAENFFLAPLTTVLAAEELLTEVRLPVWADRQSGSFVEFSKRHGDFALAGVACRVGRDAAGRCVEARLAIIGVEDVPRRLPPAEALLIEGGTVAFSDEHRRAVADAVASLVEPVEDLHASAHYRRQVVGALAYRALHRVGCAPGVDSGIDG